ncbi:unnamed protein product [Amoebophrya sp. A120]|nr:unnamed protein product [Amoebophrya sp. A120]|eukprot:GSA120T00006987001.1
MASDVSLASSAGTPGENHGMLFSSQAELLSGTRSTAGDYGADSTTLELGAVFQQFTFTLTLFLLTVATLLFFDKFPFLSKFTLPVFSRMIDPVVNPMLQSALIKAFPTAIQKANDHVRESGDRQRSVGNLILPQAAEGRLATTITNMFGTEEFIKELVGMIRSEIQEPSKEENLLIEERVKNYFVGVVLEAKLRYMETDEWKGKCLLRTSSSSSSGLGAALLADEVDEQAGGENENLPPDQSNTSNQLQNYPTRSSDSSANDDEVAEEWSRPGSKSIPASPSVKDRITGYKTNSSGASTSKIMHEQQGTRALSPLPSTELLYEDFDTDKDDTAAPLPRREEDEQRGKEFAKRADKVLRSSSSVGSGSASQQAQDRKINDDRNKAPKEFTLAGEVSSVFVQAFNSTEMRSKMSRGMVIAIVEGLRQGFNLRASATTPAVTPIAGERNPDGSGTTSQTLAAQDPQNKQSSIVLDEFFTYVLNLLGDGDFAAAALAGSFEEVKQLIKEIRQDEKINDNFRQLLRDTLRDEAIHKALMKGGWEAMKSRLNPLSR